MKFFINLLLFCSVILLADATTQNITQNITQNTTQNIAQNKINNFTDSNIQNQAITVENTVYNCFGKAKFYRYGRLIAT